MQDACKRVLQPIKKKVMEKQEKFVSKLAAKGGSLEEKQEESKGKEAIYQGHFAKFLEENQVARYVQKHIFKHSVVTQDEVALFNSISLEF